MSESKFEVRKTALGVYAVVEYPEHLNGGDQILCQHPSRFVCERLIDIITEELPEYLSGEECSFCENYEKEKPCSWNSSDYSQICDRYMPV